MSEHDEEASERGDYPPWLELLIDHFCCCFVNRPIPDPYEFKDDRKEYRALCGAFHVEQMAVIFVVVKAFLLTLFIISVALMDTSVLVVVGCGFFYLVAMASYGFLLGGISVKNYTYMIPYFTVSFISILAAVIHYFVDLLDSANTKDTLETHQLIGFATQTGAIALEVYSLAVVWRVFQYVCDYSMETEIRVKEGYKHILLETDIVVT
ncbi:hypothetical protein QR680_002822 [Steinernema hermaphroditum]|uniref:Transmembrane protein n=1 Tax=Steinernema hermaphroditum TaxID=289476 RepID=A0AA39LIG7_9BILA|nr:hypothetical protein QR680_002822 [Steinernema hermaphroditum]